MISRRKRALLQIFLIACLLATVHGQTRSQQDALHAGFLEPPAPAKLRCYWWWLNGNTTADTITHDLEGMKSHGYGGAILVDADGSGQEGNLEIRSGPPIGSPQWMALFVHALAVAQKLGLEISLNVTSRWDVGIIGGPTVTPRGRHEANDVVARHCGRRGHKENSTRGTANQKRLLSPHRRSRLSIASRSRAAGIARKRIAHRSWIWYYKTASMETGFSMPPSDRVMRDGPAIAGEEDAEFSEVVDLSSHMDESGNLEWNFPAGTWEVLRIGYTDTPTPEAPVDAARKAARPAARRAEPASL